MTSYQPKEVNSRETEKKTDHFHAKELNRYPEKMQYKDVPFNKQMETKFTEKHDRSKIETEAVKEKKSESIENMVKKEFLLSPDRQQDNTGDFHFTDKKEFQEELRKRGSSATKEDVRVTKGFYDSKDNQAYVKEDGDTLVTGIHEKLHQKSKSDLPTRLNEGITEHYAREKAGGIGELKTIDDHGREIPKAVSDYEREVKIVKQMEAVMGKNPLNRAYFDGRSDILKKHIDSQMGDGAFEKLTQALEKRDYKTAEKIIKKSR